MISISAANEEARLKALRVYDLLAEEQALRTTTSDIVVEAAEGAVVLKGRVRTNVLQRLAGRLGQAGSNGWQLRNELVSDEALALAIASKLATDERTVDADVRCEVFLGVVNLKGVVHGPEQHRVVVEIAKSVPGVLNVVDLLVVKAGSPARPAPMG